MNFIDQMVNHENILLSLAVFSMVEGSILYSSFAFLKHFQVNGKNKIPNIVTGINFSVRDENLHALGGAELYRTLLSEMIVDELTDYDVQLLTDQIKESAYIIYEHEEAIIDKLFEEGDIENITPDQLKQFVKSRINLCLNNLKCNSVFEVKDNPISEWFYLGINNYTMNDFFQRVGREYRRGWNARGFIWK